TRWHQPASRAVSFALLVVALARPQLEIQRDRVDGEGIDIMLAIDISSSMLVDDFRPTRLQVSKEVAGRFIDKRRFDRIGLTAFAGEAATQCPVTSDHFALKQFLYQLDCGMMEDGTAIGMGLATAVRRLQKSTAKSKIIILLTDGVNTMGRMAPMKAAQLAAAFDIRVYTISLGKARERQAGPAMQELSSMMNLVRVDERLLQRIASLTGGLYYSASRADALEAIYNEIDELEKSSYEFTTFRRYRDQYGYFAAFGVFFLLFEIVLGKMVLATIP
ncbi:MAG: VWA domain-containing protein, partial [Bacteroidota bacterium]